MPVPIGESAVSLTMAGWTSTKDCPEQCPQMDHYIVKIYRRARKKPRQVVGMVEDVATGSVQAFHDTDELEVILGAAPKKTTRKKSPNSHRKADFEPNE